MKKGYKGLTGGYKGLERVTGGDNWLPGVTGGYKGLQRVTKGEKELQGLTGGEKGLIKGYKVYRG